MFSADGCDGSGLDLMGNLHRMQASWVVNHQDDNSQLSSRVNQQDGGSKDEN